MLLDLVFSQIDQASDLTRAKVHLVRDTPPHTHTLAWSVTFVKEQMMCDKGKITEAEFQSDYYKRARK